MASRRPREYKSPRGTQDILPEDQPYWESVRRAASRLAAIFGYGRIETPVFEDAALFMRTVGEVTDIHLRPDGKAEVSMEIDRDVELHRGAFARVVNLGLLGEKYIELVPGPVNAPGKCVLLRSGQEKRNSLSRLARRL